MSCPFLRAHPQNTGGRRAGGRRPAAQMGAPRRRPSKPKPCPRLSSGRSSPFPLGQGSPDSCRSACGSGQAPGIKRAPLPPIQCSKETSKNRSGAFRSGRKLPATPFSTRARVRGRQKARDRTKVLLLSSELTYFPRHEIIKYRLMCAPMPPFCFFVDRFALSRSESVHL